MSYKESILQKISHNQEIVGIIGLGYVGLPLAVSFAEAGVRVMGFDRNQEKVDKINSGTNYIKDIRDAVLREVVVDKLKLEATTDMSRMKECDALIIAVPTPLDKFRKPDMSYIESACIDIGRNMKPGTFISLESTTYPTTTEDFMLPLIEEYSRQNPLAQSSALRAQAEETRNKKQETGAPEFINQNSEPTTSNISHPTSIGFSHGRDFWLAYSPERVDPGNKDFHTRNTPKVMGALTEDGFEIGEALYLKAIDHIHKVSSPRVAEMVKILENTYRLVNISLINELALLAGKMDINIWEVIEAAKTKPFGFHAFYPGPGIGGHCIPLDPFYLEHIAKKYDFDLSMIHTAGHINMRMPHYMYIKIATALNSQKKAVNGSHILFLGVAYKPNIDDPRESPALEIMDITAHKGGNVSYHDPYIQTVKTNEGRVFKSVHLTAALLKYADCVVLTTNHKDFDVGYIEEHSNLIVDLRNMIHKSSENVYKL
ncbi:MAG: nucleotide sugar dehydrogenase [Bacteroidales bacterium]|nr:nucleotide sugar dehydrogenase [Bacteroidales bacterium]